MTYGWKGAMLIICYEKDPKSSTWDVFDQRWNEISQSENKKMEFKYVHMKDAR